MAQSSSATASGTRRELTFQEGSANKFWNIELEGSKFTVTFGRIGTSGQTQTKEFDDDDAARKAYDKLVAEKIKKGYADASGGTSDPAAAPKASVAVKGAPAAKRAKAKPLEENEESQAQENGTVVDRRSAAPTTADLSIERLIRLEDKDWYRATFRPHRRLERGTPVPFDRESCLARVSKMRTETYGWDMRWKDLKLPAALSREEAEFWLEAMTTSRGRDDKPSELALKLAKKTFDGDVGVEAVAKRLSGFERNLPVELAIVIPNLLNAREIIELLLSNPPQQKNHWQHAGAIAILMEGFCNYVYPYLSAEEIEQARQPLRNVLDPTQTPATFYEALPVGYYLAAALGMHSEVYELTSSWADDRYMQDNWTDHYQRPQDIVFGLGSAELVESEWRRLHLRMRSAEHVRAFLACTEYSALGCVRDSILAETNKERCEELLDAFVLVEAPEAAEPMLECKLSSKTPGKAREWLDRNTGHAVAGLLQTAAGRGKLADAAIDYLRVAKKQGHAEFIAARLKSFPDADVAAKVQREVLDHVERTFQPLTDETTPDWLRSELVAVGKLKSRNLPAWANVATLPPLTIGDQRLSDEQVATVLNVLVATPVSTSHALLSALREHVDRHSRDDFAWKLFQFWLEDGAPSKEKWAMGAIGQLGGDACALKLTPLVRQWPGESQHQRAVFGLECLRAIGSDVALMQLSGCAQKLKFKGLKAKAEEFVNEIAKDRGMTRAELEDRVVPDCGLDEQGRREFSFGSRTFSFVLGIDLKAMIRDSEGKVRGDLPKPGGKDDAAQAEQALADWKLMKKQIKEVATIQAGRLEQAMVTGRRWRVEDFQTLLVQHPLMTHLARSLVWGAFDKQGQRVATFRVTEERDFADVKDQAASLGKAETVGVLHPLELSDAERSAWGEVLSDYEIISPFPQFGRAVYTLEAGEAEQDDLQRFHKLKLVAPTLVFTLEKLGWQRGLAMDGGCFDEHSKQFPAAGVTAVIGYEGTVGMGYIDPNEMLTITSVQFVGGMRPPSGYGWDKQGVLRLGDVPPVVMSEVLADLQFLRSKAK